MSIDRDMSITSTELEHRSSNLCERYRGTSAKANTIADMEGNQVPEMTCHSLVKAEDQTMPPLPKISLIMI